MLDCEHGQWVLGRPHSQTGALRTMAYGLMSDEQTASTHSSHRIETNRNHPLPFSVAVWLRRSFCTEACLRLRSG